MDLPSPGMTIDARRTALVLTDLQNDFLSPGGIAWGLVADSLAEQVHRDVGGAGLAVVLGREGVSGVPGPAVVATAGGLAAALVDLGQAGRPDRPVGGQLLEPAGQPAADPGGVVGDVPSALRRCR
jgi:hypothetical protein